jgi:hypothetical protein
MDDASSGDVGGFEIEFSMSGVSLLNTSQYGYSKEKLTLRTIFFSLDSN